MYSLSIRDIFDDVTWPISEFKVISSRPFENLSVIRLTYLLFRVTLYVGKGLFTFHSLHYYNHLFCSTNAIYDET